MAGPEADDIQRLGMQLFGADNTADEYGLLDSIEKIAKRRKAALRSRIEMDHGSDPLLYGALYALHLFRQSNHETVRYAKVCEDLAPLIDLQAFEAIKAANTFTSDQLTIRATARRR